MPLPALPLPALPLPAMPLPALVCRPRPAALRPVLAAGLTMLAAGCAQPDLPPARLPPDAPYPVLVPAEPLLAEAARPPAVDPEAARRAQEAEAAALRARAARLRATGPGA